MCPVAVSFLNALLSTQWGELMQRGFWPELGQIFPTWWQFTALSRSIHWELLSWKNSSSLSICMSQRDVFHLILPSPLLWAHSSLPFPQHWGKPLLLQGEASLDAIFPGCKGIREVNSWLSLHKLLCPFLEHPLFDSSPDRSLCQLAAGKSLMWSPKKQNWHLKCEILE